MNFGLSQEISEDICDKAPFITDISNSIEDYFKERDYGTGLMSLTIGIISVHPKFDFFFKPRKKYTKSKKLLEYDIKLDHEKLATADKAAVLELICEQLLSSFNLLDEIKIPLFDKEQFKNDLEMYFEELRRK